MPTPTSIVPQANKLELIREVVDLARKGQLGDMKVARTKLGLEPRHVGYYREAAVALGVLTVDQGSATRATQLGAELLSSAPGSRQEAKILVRGAKEGGHLADFADYLSGDEDVPREQLVRRIRLAADLSDSTANRRAQCLIAWRNRLAKLLAHESSPPLTYGQLHLFSGHEPGPLQWPDAQRFPYNDPAHRRRVGDVVRDDLASSDRILMITGYSSLEYLVDFLGTHGKAAGDFRVAFGVEPAVSQRREYGLLGRSVSDEVRDYWLERGISIRYGTKVMATLGLLEAGALKVRLSGHYRSRLHAKVFVTPNAATLGSSNFSPSGMADLLEANARFRSSERKRYEETRQLAEACWDSAADFSDGFTELLNQLLQRVTWEEALARAAAELLEGKWARGAESRYADALAELWPSQKQGIAQALWILDNVGSVLVADATGSGKTRLAAHLMRALRDRMLTTGRARAEGMRPVDPVVIVPPATMDRWKDELVDCGLHLEPHSQGRLSLKEGPGPSRLGKALQRAQVLAVDEAHNFLNYGAIRTASLLGNMADHTVLFTATPINRSVRDLVSIVNLLGADNLDEAGVKLVRSRQWQSGKGGAELTPEDVAALRKEVQRFTVRRTKQMLNALVDREPGAYQNDQGDRCGYPRPITRTYSCNESDEDRDIAARIRELADQLRGLVNLRKPIVMPDWMRSQWTEQQYVRFRLRGAAGLAKYHVMASLRSSRAALVEHLRGTDHARRLFEVPVGVKPAETGDVLGTLGGLPAPTGQPLERWLPDWLRQQAVFEAEMARERSLYEEIYALCERMSDGREQARAQLLVRLLSDHHLVLAFDSRPISLGVLKKQLAEVACRVVVATGASKKKERRAVQSTFALGSSARKVVALCSDAMSEGLNLQAGSVIVHLDMPSVMRIAEQRIGRIDRMDSPHDSIEILWPDDPPELALRSDEHFAARHELVKGVLGSNIDIPGKPADALVDKATLEELGRREEAELSVDDAFAPVRALVDGPTAIVPPRTYQQIRTSEATVISAVSVVRSAQPWAFFAIRGTDTAAPRWALFADEDGEPLTALDHVAETLRTLLPAGTESVELDDRAMGYVERFVTQLRSLEHALLPPKKRRALEQMQQILGDYLRLALREGPPDRRAVLEGLCAVVDAVPSAPYVDRRLLADRWLGLIRPRWHEALIDPRRRSRRPLLLRDLDKRLRSKPFTAKELRAAFADLPHGEPVDRRIAAAIVGVP